MDNSRTTSTPPGPTGTGEVTTFYAYQDGPARNLVLANMAWLLAGRQHATVAVLMIDWDLESPGLHYLFGAGDDRPGLLELLEACRDRHAALLHELQSADSAVDPDDLACRVLAMVDWQRYVERVDAARPLYMLRAGRFDDTYGERAARLDWHGLYRSCPALLRQFRLHLVQAFQHVFIDARCGRSAAVSVCTALLPDKIVGLFSPHPASLDGLRGAIERAIAYRCSHEEEQRPLLLYPLPCAPAGAAQWQAWRRGPRGYQAQLEALMRTSYGLEQVSLERYCDDILLRADALDGSTAPARGPAPVAFARTLATLLDWIDGHFPWQSQAAPVGVRTVGSGQGSHVVPGPNEIPTHGTGGSVRQAQFPALRHLGTLLGGGAFGACAAVDELCTVPGRTGSSVGPGGAATPFEQASGREWLHAAAREHGVEALLEPAAAHMRRLADALEAQLDQLQQLVERQALPEARSLADTLRHLVLRPAVALALRRRGTALIKLVYRHDNDTDALLAFTQDELAALERALSDVAAGRPLAYS